MVINFTLRVAHVNWTCISFPVFVNVIGAVAEKPQDVGEVRAAVPVGCLPFAHVQLAVRQCPRADHAHNSHSQKDIPHLKHRFICLNNQILMMLCDARCRQMSVPTLVFLVSVAIVTNTPWFRKRFLNLYYVHLFNIWQRDWTLITRNETLGVCPQAEELFEP